MKRWSPTSFALSGVLATPGFYMLFYQALLEYFKSIWYTARSYICKQVSVDNTLVLSWKKLCFVVSNGLCCFDNEVFLYRYYSYRDNAVILATLLAAVPAPLHYLWHFYFWIVTLIVPSADSAISTLWQFCNSCSTCWLDSFGVLLVFLSIDL